MGLKHAKSHLCQDKVLNEVISNHKILKLQKSGNVYNELVKNIIYQQISYKAADKIYGRLLEKMVDSKFPPRKILNSDPEEIRAVGLSRQKLNYIYNISEFFEDHKLYNKQWGRLSDEEIISLLTQIKGVGTWTVEMILIFELQRPDVLPVKDLAIQQAMKYLYNFDGTGKTLFDNMYRIAEDWQPFRSYATLYLWSWCRNNMNKLKSGSKG